MTSEPPAHSMRRFYEADLSTQQPPPQAHARIPAADADAFRPRRSLGAPPQGAQKTRGVSQRPAVSETFSRDDRLRKRREFEECYASGARVSGRFLQVFLLAEEGRPRLGISVPKRVGNAAARNRVRRRLREIFRRNRDLLGSRGMRIVVNARPPAAEAPFSALCEDYRSSVSRGLARARPPVSR